DQDSRTVLWTVICATKESKVSARFAFELELYSPVDSWKLLVQRFPCHSELDPDFLKDGHCSKIPLADALRFMTDDKVLHYRVRVLEVGPSRSQSLMKLSNGTASTSHLPTNYCCKHIENVNLKAVPEGNIICRKQPSINTDSLSPPDDDDVFLPYVDAEEDGCSTPGKTVRLQCEPNLPNRSSSLRLAASVPMLAQPAQQATFESPDEVELQPIQQLVRVKVAEREQAVRMHAQYAVRKPSAKPNGIERGSSSESLATKPSKGTGLSKFYNVTMYKAAKFLDKKGIK
uniref:E3 ubiquitin-protein ligase n=1 Tax=Anopheles maculatus TaxID=74869 RepID=A0A182SKP4_9DIPT